MTNDSPKNMGGGGVAKIETPMELVEAILKAEENGFDWQTIAYAVENRDKAILSKAGEDQREVDAKIADGFVCEALGTLSGQQRETAKDIAHEIRCSVNYKKLKRPAQGKQEVKP